ncbi:hypothetical protein PtB15_13B248 [Puccinia triticina]|nr:hypothetical protein PtB15_13B248 [Puccinia triticina]
MAGNAGMSGLINSFELLQSEDQKEEAQNYEGQVMKEIVRINNEYHSIWDRINYGQEPLAIFNEIAIRTQLLAKLQSKSLPSLRRHVLALSRILLLRRSDPPLDNQPMPLVYKWKLMLKVLLKLESTLRDVKFAIACISPALDSKEMRDDKDFKQLKFFRSSRLALRTYAATGKVGAFLQNSYRFIYESGQHCYEDSSRRHEIETMAIACSESINWTLIYISKSEVNVFQDAWEGAIESISDSLGNARPVNDTSDTPPQADHIRLSHTPLSIISVIKLSRIFVAKLLKISTDKENLTMVSDLSSREIDMFGRTTQAISESIARLVDALRAANPDDQVDDSEIMTKSISDLLGAPRVILLLLQHIFRPVHPDRLWYKIHLKAWFYQWNKLHRLATQQFLDDITMS